MLLELDGFLFSSAVHWNLAKKENIYSMKNTYVFEISFNIEAVYINRSNSQTFLIIILRNK